jgi:glycosyltransferase involved in cell wall biosynthesis
MKPGRRERRGAQPSSVFVVPCYREADRLRADLLLELVEFTPSVHLVLVDDGSPDDTFRVLERVRDEARSRVQVLRLPRNVGKGEAVRAGMTHALARDANAREVEAVGYFDADMATPVGDLQRIVAELADERLHAVLGSRVLLMGHAIQRNPTRHYVGRAFATMASAVLKQPLYDTQCGAKLFRRSEALEAALTEPFLTRWLFDVELLGRLLVGDSGVAPLAPGAIRELPLHEWRDVAGSKVRTADVARASLDIVRVAAALERRRRRAQHGARRP